MRDETECKMVRGKEVRFTQESERARESQLACAREGAGFGAKNKSAEDSVSNIVCCVETVGEIKLGEGEEGATWEIQALKERTGPAR